MRHGRRPASNPRLPDIAAEVIDSVRLARPLSSGPVVVDNARLHGRRSTTPARQGQRARPHVVWAPFPTLHLGCTRVFHCAVPPVRRGPQPHTQTGQR